MKHTTITHKTMMKLGATKNDKALQAAKKSRISSKEQQTIQIILNNIVRELEVHKVNNGGRMPYGAISEVILAKQKNLPWLIIHQVRNQTIHQVKQQLKKTAQLEVKSTGTTACTGGGGAAAATPSISTTTTLSTLTHPECEYGTHFPPSSLPMTSNMIMHSSFEVQEDEKDEGQYKSKLTEKEGTANNDKVDKKKQSLLAT
jgi:hypothetical protein